MAICAILMLVFFFPIFFLPNYKRFKYSEFVVIVMSHFMNSILLMMRIKVIDKNNVDKKRTTLYICNHQSWIDIPLFISHCAAPIISKKEIKYVPLLGPIATMIGTIFFDRDKTSDRLGVIKATSQVFKKGCSLCVFPEGTRSLDGNLGEPNLALIKLCYKLNVSVVPASLHGTINALPKHVHYFKPLQKAVLKYHPAIMPADFKNADDFANKCWTEVVTTHEEIMKGFFNK
jgi:1-acyl-sn-glycerol-3-phosphate acyltransferase